MNNKNILRNLILGGFLIEGKSKEFFKESYTKALEKISEKDCQEILNRTLSYVKIYSGKDVRMLLLNIFNIIICFNDDSSLEKVFSLTSILNDAELKYKEMADVEKYIIDSRELEKVTITDKNFYEIEEIYTRLYKCPSCAFLYIFDNFTYCPNCGAKIEWLLSN